MFDVLLNEKLRHAVYSVDGFLVTMDMVFRCEDDEFDSVIQLWRSRAGRLVTFIQAVVFAIILCPLAVLYLSGLVISTSLSLWRLIQRDYGDGDGSANLTPALNVLYSLALFQGVLFFYQWVSYFAGKRLIEKVASKYWQNSQEGGGGVAQIGEGVHEEDQDPVREGSILPRRVEPGDVCRGADEAGVQVQRLRVRGDDPGHDPRAEGPDGAARADQEAGRLGVLQEGDEEAAPVASVREPPQPEHPDARREDRVASRRRDQPRQLPARAPVHIVAARRHHHGAGAGAARRRQCPVRSLQGAHGAGPRHPPEARRRRRQQPLCHRHRAEHYLQGHGARQK